MSITTNLLTGITTDLTTNILSRTIVPLAINQFNAILDGDSLSSSQVFANESSTSIDRRATGAWTQFAARMYQAFNLTAAQSYGTSGHTIADVLSGQATPLSYIGSNPVDDVFLFMGTNDVEGSTSIPDLTTSATSIIDAYLATGVDLFVILPTVRADFQGDPDEDTFVQRLHDIRGLLRDICATRGKAHIVDAYNDMVDTGVVNAGTGLTYFPLSGMLVSDGVHFSFLGSNVISSAMERVYKQVKGLKNPNTLVDVSNTITTNPSLSGTGGTLGTGATGVVADNAQVRRAIGSNVSAVCSKETRTLFGIQQECQKIVISSATVDNEEIYFEIERDDANFRNEVFDGTTACITTLPIRIEGAVGVKNIYVFNRVTVGSSYIESDMINPSNGGFWPEDTTFEYLMRNDPKLIPAGTSTRLQMLVRFIFDGTVSSNGVTAWIGQTSIDKVVL